MLAKQRAFTLCVLPKIITEISYVSQWLEQIAIALVYNMLTLTYSIIKSIIGFKYRQKY